MLYVLNDEYLVIFGGVKKQNTSSMKKLILIAALTIVNLSITKAQSQLNINLAESTVEWIGEKVTGSHTGNIALKSAHFIMGKEHIEGGVFVMDMNSIKCTDIESPEYATKLEDHLKDNDFFGIDSFPTANFSFAKVIFDGTSYLITGKMNIKGMSQEITFPAQFHTENGILIADAVVKIDRTKHDIKYGSGAFFDGLGDRMILDDFTLNIHLVTE
ncbi:MAG: polyisoprenoid-binding protein YceI [Flavobacteriales bacterium]|jgi:polyisoprenoid-binding protein YceI